MKNLGKCPKGHNWMRSIDAHGCKVRVCIRCTNGYGQQLVDSSTCKEYRRHSK